MTASKGFFTDEQKAAMAVSAKAYWANHTHPNKGVPMTEEQKTKIRTALANRPQGPMADEQKEKIRKGTTEYWQTHTHPSKGVAMGQEQKDKIRTAHLARQALIEEALAALAKSKVEAEPVTE